MRKKIYLAIAYTGYEDLSFELANKEAAKLINEGHFVFSPISMSHPISKLGGLDGSWDTWKELDMEFIRWCDEVHVINFNDLATKNSVGVNDEIKYAKEIGKEVIYIQKF
jgi:hypothetical protein